MKIIRPTLLPVVSSISCRLAFVNALSFAIALIARTALFVSDFHAIHSANVIGFPFLGNMLILSASGTLIGVIFSLAAYERVRRTKIGLSQANIALAYNCLLLPLAFFLVFIFPHYFMHGVDFD